MLFIIFGMLFINGKIKVEDNFKNTLKRVHLNCGPPLYDQAWHQDDPAVFSKDITVCSLFTFNMGCNMGW